MPIYVGDKDKTNKTTVVPEVVYNLTHTDNTNSETTYVALLSDSNYLGFAFGERLQFNTGLPNDGTTRSITVKVHVKMTGGSIQNKNIIIVSYDANNKQLANNYNSFQVGSERSFEITRNIKWGEGFQIKAQHNGYLYNKGTTCAMDITIILGEFTKTEAIDPTLKIKIGGQDAKMYVGTTQIL